MNDFGWDNKGTELQSEWMRYQRAGRIGSRGSDVGSLCLHPDADFARTALLPMAEHVTYYDEHWKRDRMARFSWNRLRR